MKIAFIHCMDIHNYLHYQSVIVNPYKNKLQTITPMAISAICLPLYEVCSVTIKSVEFRLAKFNALNGGIRNTKLNIEINQSGSKYANKLVAKKPIKSKIEE